MTQASKRLTEGRLNWYRHVMRRDEEHTEKSVENGYTRKKEERTTKNKRERRVPTRLQKYLTENGRGDGQGDLEKEDQQSYW